MYKKKYLKYKEKYNNLLKLKGGDFRTKPDLCINTNKYIVEFLNIITSNKENEETKGDIEEKTINDKINSLYNEALNEDKSISELLRDLFFLFDIEIIENKYKNPVVCNINDIDDNGFPQFACLENIDVWYKPYRLEDFWRCTIEEFMDEYDNFEKTELSYLLFWDNLLNITSLLCRIKSCKYYFIKTDDDSVIPKSKEEYDEMIENNKIVLMENIMLPIMIKKLGIKLVLTEITFEKKINEYKDLLILLLQSFNCMYDNILLFYLKFLCILKEIEIENQHFNKPKLFGDLSTSIIDICSETNTNLKSKSIYIYLSLNLPRDSTYTRNEYTKIVCTSINSTKLIDNLPLSMVQIVSHDYSFHNAEDKKLKTNGISKFHFRNFITKINTIKEKMKGMTNENREHVLLFLNEHEIINEDELVNDTEFELYTINFIDTLKKEYIIFNVNNFFEMVHYIFHEKGNGEKFKISIFNEQITYYLFNLVNITFLNQYADLLNFYKNIIKYLLISKTYNNLENNIEILLQYLIKIIIISEYLKKKKDERFIKSIINKNVELYKKILNKLNITKIFIDINTL